MEDWVKRRVEMRKVGLGSGGAKGGSAAEEAGREALCGGETWEVCESSGAGAAAGKQWFECGRTTSGGLTGSSIEGDCWPTVWFQCFQWGSH